MTHVNVKSEADLELLVDTLELEIRPLCQAMENRVKRLSPDTPFSAEHVFGQIKEYAKLVHEGSTKTMAAELIIKPLKDYIDTAYAAVAKDVESTTIAARHRASDRNDILKEVNGIMADFGLGRATGASITGA